MSVRRFFKFCLLLPFVASADVTSTRVTTYDWQCQDANGNRISDHTRFDTAFVACLNAVNGSLVKGGTYRITKDPNQAVLTWTAPTMKTDGTALTDLQGYRIYYGLNPESLDRQTSLIAAPALTTTITGLTNGTWFFSITAIRANGEESARSNLASKTIG